MEPWDTQNPKNKKREHSKKQQKHNPAKSGSVVAFWLQKWTKLSCRKHHKIIENPEILKIGTRDHPGPPKLAKFSILAPQSLEAHCKTVSHITQNHNFTYYHRESH